MAQRVLLFLIVLVALVAITFLLMPQEQDWQWNSSTVPATPPFAPSSPVIRPEIPRTNDPGWQETPPEPIPVMPPPPTNRSVFLVKRESATIFRIPLSGSLGAAYPLLTKEELPSLKPAPLQTGDGHFRSYAQFLRFSFGENTTGNVTFIDDSRREYFGTALLFREDLPLLEYALDLQGRLFFDPRILGAKIRLLGNDFQVQEATNVTLALNGLDVSQYLFLHDNRSLESNKQTFTNTIVNYDGAGFSYRLDARALDRGGLFLREGETLRQRLRERHLEPSLIGQQFDIHYDGPEPLPLATPRITFAGFEDRVALTWSAAGIETTIPLAGIGEDSIFSFGDGDVTFHARECASSAHGCIHEDDLVLFEGRVPDKKGLPGAPATIILRVSGIDDEGRTVLFKTLAGERIVVDLRRTATGAVGSLALFDREYAVFVSNTTTNVSGTLVSVPTNLSIDQDGVGGVNGRFLDLLVTDTLRIVLSDITYLDATRTWGVMNVTVETAPFAYVQHRASDGIMDKELLRFQIVAEDGVVRTVIPKSAPGVVGSQEMLETPDERGAFRLSPWGSEIGLRYDRDDSVSSTTDDVVVLVPLEQRFAAITIGILNTTVVG